MAERMRTVEPKPHVEWETPVEPTIEQAITTLRFLSDITIYGGRQDRLAGNTKPSEAFQKATYAIHDWLGWRDYGGDEGVEADAQKLLDLAGECRDQGLESGIHILRMFWDSFAEDIGCLIDDNDDPFAVLDSSTRSVPTVCEEDGQTGERR